jgi:glycerophosphoryl diester phosphodiesterase
MEVDVMLTKDKVPVIHHDNTLDRCTDGHGFFTPFAWPTCAKRKKIKSNGVSSGPRLTLHSISASFV